MRTDALIDKWLLTRVFGVLGPAEAFIEMLAFVTVLLAGGWVWGGDPSAALLATASGAAFATVVLGQMATAFACRSQTRWVGRLDWRGNPLLIGAVVIELAILFVFIGVPPLAELLGGSLPPLIGWTTACLVIPAVFLADAAQKEIRYRASRAALRTIGPPPHTPLPPSRRGPSGRAPWRSAGWLARRSAGRSARPHQRRPAPNGRR